MKANAPEKLYLDATSKCGDTVFTIKNNDTDIEYTRTDAFIKKATSWLKEQNEMIGVSFQKDFLERFINYMKGE